MSASEENLEKKDLFLGVSLNSDNAVHVISLLAEQPNFHINAINGEGISLLHCAVAIDNISVGLIKLLLKNGADAELKDQNGRTPLVLALQLGKKDIAHVLLEHIQSKTLNLKAWKEFFIKDLEKADLKSAKDRLRRVVEEHKEAIGDFVHAECHGRPVLWYACVCVDAEFIRLLASNGVRFGNEATLIESPLYWVITATRNSFIMGREIDVNEDKKCAALQVLLEAGANLDFQEDSREALEQCAVASNSPKVLTFLLEKRLGPKEVSPAMLFELTMASSPSSTSSSKPEISYPKVDASTKIHGNDSEISMHFAEGGVTPLHLAVRNNHITTVESLFRTARNVGINIQDGKGFTALHYAVLNGHIGMVQLLLRQGAAMNIKNNQGKTACELSKDLRLNSISQLFIDHAAMDLQRMGVSALLTSESGDPGTIISYLTQGSRRFMQEFGQNRGTKPSFSSQNKAKHFKKITKEDLKLTLSKWLKKLLKQGYDCSFIEESNDLCKIKIYHADFYILSSTYVVLSDNKDDSIKAQYFDGAIILSLSIQGDRAGSLIQLLTKPIQYYATHSTLVGSLRELSPDRSKVLSVEPEKSEGQPLFFKVSYRINNSAMKDFKQSVCSMVPTENPLQKNIEFQEKDAESVLTLRYHCDVFFDWKTRKAYCELLDKARSASQTSSSSSSITRLQPETKSESAPKFTSKPEKISYSRLFLISLRADEELATHFKGRAKQEKTFILFKRGRDGYCLYRPRQDEEVVFLETSEEGLKIANNLRKNILAFELPQKEINFFERIPHDRFKKGGILEFTETDFCALSGPSSDLSFSELLEKLDAEPAHLFCVAPEREEAPYLEYGYKRKKMSDRRKKKEHFFESEDSLESAILSKPGESKKKTSFVPESVFFDKKDEWVESPDGKFYPAGMLPEEKSKKKEKKPEIPEKQKSSSELLREEIQQIGYLLDKYSEVVRQKNVFEQGIIPGAIYRSLTKAILLRMEVIQDKIDKAPDDMDAQKLKRIHHSLSRLRNYLVHYFCLLHPWNERRAEFLLYLGEWVRNQFKFSKRNEKFDGVLNIISRNKMNIDDEKCRKTLLEVEKKFFEDVNELYFLSSEFLIEKLLKGLKYLDGLFKVLDGNPQALLPEDKKRKKYYYVACASITMVVEYNNFLMKKKPKVIIPELQEMLYGANNKLRKPLVHEGNLDYNFNHNALLMVAGQLSSLIEFIEKNLKSRGMSGYILDLIDAQSLYPNPYALFESGSPQEDATHSSKNITSTLT